MNKPLLLLDVDGVLNPYAAKPNKRPDGYNTFYVGKYWDAADKKLGKNYIRVWVNPSHGPKLLDLTDVADLVWTTTWNDHANDLVSPRVGLPTNLPVLHVDSYNDSYRSDLAGNAGLRKVFYKSWFVKNYVKDLPFLWLDDDHTDYDTDYLSCFTTAPFKLYKVDPKVGLTDDDFTNIRNWFNKYTV